MFLLGSTTFVCTSDWLELSAYQKNIIILAAVESIVTVNIHYDKSLTQRDKITET